MKNRWVVGGCAACFALATMSGVLLAQEKPGKDKPATKGPAGKEDAKAGAGKEGMHGQMPSKEEIDAQMAEMAKLAKEHEILKSLAGTWKTQSKCSNPMDPSAPPEISSGTHMAKLILGGRWLVGDYSGTMEGKPFEGHGMWGYDTQKKKFINIWTDNWSTQAMVSEGELDPTGKIITFKCTYDCPIQQKPVSMRMVTTIKSPSEHLFEMYTPGPDGKEFKCMEITYTK